VSARAATMAMSDSPSQAAAVFHAPWPLLAAALVSFLSLGLTVPAVAVMPFLALLLLAAWIFDARLKYGWPIWAARAMLFAIVIFALGLQGPSHAIGFFVYNPHYVYPFGQLCAAELVVQCWIEHPTGGPRAFGVMLLSAAVFTCSTTTYGRHIPWLAPAFFLFIALALSGSRGLGMRGWAILAAAICLGAAVRYAMYANEGRLSNLAMLFIARRHAGDTIGLSEAPVLGRTQLAYGSNTRVLRLEGACTTLYLRALVFDTYIGGSWWPIGYRPDTEPVSPASLCPSAPGQRWSGTRLASEVRYLFVPLNCAGLVPEADSRLAWDPLHRSPIFNEDSGTYSYDVIMPPSSHLQTEAAERHQGPFCVPLSVDLRLRCLAVPDGAVLRYQYQRYPAVRELAQRIGGHLDSPLERVQAVVKYLQDNHEYSLSTDPGQGDPVANFLLEKKGAHCEYFASAAVLLLRCLNVPSRYVTGYLAHEFAGPNKMVVRGRDAHAWAESWIAGRGWVTVEATPHSGLPSVLQPVSFFVRAMEWFEDSWALLVAWFRGLSWRQLLVRAATVAVAYGLVAGLWRKAGQLRRRRAASAAAAYPGPNEALRALALRFEDFLRRAGAPCPAHLTWQEHLAGFSPSRSEAGQGHSESRRLALNLVQAREFLNQYNAVRFGTPDDVQATGKLRAVLRRLEDSPP